MKFQAKGTVKIKGNLQKFTRTIEAKSKSHAEDVLLATLGSNYRIHRRDINIEELKEVRK